MNNSSKAYNDLFDLCKGMDEMTFEEKARCISFGNAMNAIEGVSVSEETAEELAEWQKGSKTYLEVFVSTLRRYGFLRE